MQEFVRRLALGIILIVLFFLAIGFIKEANASDYSDANELFILNQAGGVIAVSKELCDIPQAKAKGFEFKGYATEKDGTRHEGCWAAPDISDAPKTPGVRIIPIVNMYFDGEIIMLPQHQFKPLKELENAL